MQKYECVSPAELIQARLEIEQVLNRVKSEMSDRYNLHFQSKLAGSAKVGLATRVKNGNKGFDLDYDLIIPPSTHDRYRANEIKQKFISAFDTAIEGSPLSFAQDSTSVITLRKVDRIKKRRLYSCDFAIIYYGQKDAQNGYFYLRNDKKAKNYHFSFRPEPYDIERKVQAIQSFPGGRTLLFNEYVMLKSKSNNTGKCSYSLYKEAVNNVYNQVFTMHSMRASIDTPPALSLGVAPSIAIDIRL